MARPEKLCFFQIVPGIAMKDCNEENTMTKISVLGIATVAATVAFAMPAYAQHRMNPANTYARADSCAYEPGNPHNRVTDFIAWSGYRGRGGWDDRTDIKCGPAMHHSSY
ncbi:hypothetical protein [Bradyrhizobium sp.]|uniref:hypothetical protein n=1 Tax=Bradyrhizobium sp. TaxID=376 RepID=UPI002D5B7598|nr:hypothetical protein [Bradyrhizobium sp.]HZR71553.1 hypothetical protein [Bradyrhizobium sp.]